MGINGLILEPWNNFPRSGLRIKPRTSRMENKCTANVANENPIFYHKISVSNICSRMHNLYISNTNLCFYEFFFFLIDIGTFHSGRELSGRNETSTSASCPLLQKDFFLTYSLSTSGSILRIKLLFFPASRLLPFAFICNFSWIVEDMNWLARTRPHDKYFQGMKPKNKTGVFHSEKPKHFHMSNSANKFRMSSYNPIIAIIFKLCFNVAM